MTTEVARFVGNQIRPLPYALFVGPQTLLEAGVSCAEDGRIRIYVTDFGQARVQTLQHSSNVPQKNHL